MSKRKASTLGDGHQSHKPWKWRNQLTQLQAVQVLEKDKSFPGYVLDVDHDKKEVFIHYNGFPSTYDEWIPWKSPRLQYPLPIFHTLTKPTRSDQKHNLEICQICLDRLKNPTQALVCGHMFCNGCLQRFHQDRPDICPSCNVTRTFVKDVHFERMQFADKVECQGCANVIDGDKVSSSSSNFEICPKSKYTCDLCQETLKSFDPEHYQTCTGVRYECGFSMLSFSYSEFKKHIRDYLNCMQCGTPFQRYTDRIPHIETCPNNLLTCPFKYCAYEGTWKEIQEHAKNGRQEHYNLLRNEY